MRSLVHKEIYKFKSLKHFYEYYDNFLDSLETRDSHNSAPYNQRVNYVPTIALTCYRRVGDLSAEDHRWLNGVRNFIPESINLKPIIENMFDLEKEQIQSAIRRDLLEKAYQQRLIEFKSHEAKYEQQQEKHRQEIEKWKQQNLEKIRKAKEKAAEKEKERTARHLKKIKQGKCKALHYL